MSGRRQDMILVTGATGFVGQALCEELSNRGLACRSVSRRARPGFFPIGKLDGKTDWSDALRDVQCVIHLAARVHVMKENAADPLVSYRETNVAATLNLARQAAVSGVKRFVFVSSIKVNGELTTEGRPFTSSDIPQPQGPYAQSKWEAEQGLHALGRETGMEIVVVRPPLVYGPGVKANFASLMRWAGRGILLPLGSINNKRSVVFVGNLVDFLILATQHPQAAGQTFLVSDGSDPSTTELLRKLAVAQGRQAILLPFPSYLLSAAARLLGQGAVASRLLDWLQVSINHTQSLTGWKPPYSLDEGLRRTVQTEQKT